MRALVVGAGIGGLATSIALSRRGVDVVLVERRAQVETLGSGITLIGPALRALDTLGVLDGCVEEGYGITKFDTLDLDGGLVSSFDLPSPAGTDHPGMLGMMRPTLHRVLLVRATADGTTIRTGVSPRSIDHRPEGDEVVLDDGTREVFDLVVGADGLRSSVRELVLGAVPLTFRGQGCIRMVLPRPDDVVGEVQYHPAGDVFVGFTPTSATRMYAYCSFPVEERGWPTPAELVDLVRHKVEPFGGLMSRVREHIADPDQVNLAKFHTVLAPRPWGRGRTVLVGDAAHCPTPQLAAGAAMCLEDAVALGEEIDAAPGVEDALARFFERRFDRCRFVVDTATQLSHWQTYPGSLDAEHERVTAEAFAQLARPF